MGLERDNLPTLQFDRPWRFLLFPGLAIQCLFCLAILLLALPAIAAELPAPISLVVMIEGKTPIGKAVAGAGLVVGATADGEALIVTARHVVSSPPDENTFGVRFFEDPAALVEAKLRKDDFGKDLDLALITAPMPAKLTELDYTTGLPLGRLEGEFVEGEAASLIGQSGNQRWSVSTGNQKITVDQGDTVQVLSFEAGPGSSGGIALDSSDRIVGIALSDDRYAISVLKLSVIATQLRAAGIGFSIVAAEARDLVSEADYEPMVRRLLTSAQPELLVNVQPNARAVAAVNALLDEDKTLLAFVAAFRSDEAIGWLSSLVDSGFDPNRLVSIPGERERSLLYPVLKANNVPLAIGLLQSGASPYVYEELWGQEYDQPLLLFPLEWLGIVSATTGEKAALIEAMVAAGLTSQGGADDVAARYEVAVPTEYSLREPANDIICRNFSRRGGYDWCKEVEALPVGLQGLSDGWHDEFKYAHLVKLVSVTNDTMQVLTRTTSCCWTDAEYGLMEISKGADRIIWYRHISPGAGLGHCEELRGEPDWKPDYGWSTTCWRRQTMLRDADGQFFVTGYDSVRYNGISADRGP